MANLIYSALPQPRRPIIYVKPTLPLSECVKMMTEQDVGALVVSDSREVLGLVSERDIVRSCLSLELSLNELKAIDVAYAEVSILDINDSVEKAMEVMTKTKRRHILIEEDGELFAILSIGDLLFYLLEDRAHVIEQLETYIGTDGRCKI